MKFKTHVEIKHRHALLHTLLNFWAFSLGDFVVWTSWSVPPHTRMTMTSCWQNWAPLSVLPSVVEGTITVHHTTVRCNKLTETIAGVVQERTNIAGCRQISLKSTAFKCGYASGNWDFRRPSTIPRSEELLTGLNCLRKPYGLFWTPIFFLKVWNFDTCQKKTCDITDI